MRGFRGWAFRVGFWCGRPLPECGALRRRLKGAFGVAPRWAAPTLDPPPPGAFSHSEGGRGRGRQARVSLPLACACGPVGWGWVRAWGGWVKSCRWAERPRGSNIDSDCG
ncbi:hypothetical protein GCM10022244_09230 [Streptomyces gulbargensis]|uniref:Uncharacterized protein n=1 Tax=Streptomyces gulbargensis TaxID=364901 RepID=A0ABP7LKH4_9ACTN